MSQPNFGGGAQPTNRYRICDGVGRPISPDWFASNFQAAQTVAHLYCSALARTDGQLVVVDQGLPYQPPVSIGIATSGALTAAPSGTAW